MDKSSLVSSFDFNSQAGVMKVLAAIRQSTISPEAKNELRDLVFLYSNGGGEQSVRLSLEQRLASYHITPVLKVEPKPEVVAEAVISAAAPEVPTAVKEEPVVPVFGSARLAPTFVTKAPLTAPEVVAAPILNKVENTKVEVAAEASIAKPAPVLMDLPTSVPMATPPMMPKEVIPESKPETVPTPTIPVTPFPDINVPHLDRIREIKAAVNSKVGNPVNLVDINNEVGREYMNALLDAMKRLSNGAGQIDQAMQRLEVAFLAVEKVVSEHEASVNNPTKVDEVTQNQIQNEVPTSPTPEIISEPVAQDEVAKNLEVKTIIAEPVTLAREFTAPKATVEAPVNKYEVRSTPAPKAVFEPIINTKTEEVVPEAVIERPVAVPPRVEPVSSIPVASTVPAEATLFPVVPSVLEGTRIRTPDELPTVDSRNAEFAGDPIYSREVDDGLEQLLSDWILFKKSGLFGSGPKGREHPLYKKLATLPIPHLLTGRFEGSTQEIKQSITDYMNGWRYEQGIIYEQGETFEHYLRRVIKHILDLQKKRRAS